MIRHVILALLLVVWSVSAQADPAARVSGAFQTWLDQQNASGAFALVRKGKVVARQGFGMDVTQPVELASLSKAVTAICAKELVAQGVLGWQDLTTEHLESAPEVTLAALLVHGSGFARDSTQTLMQGLLDSGEAHQSEAVLRAVKSRKTQKSKRNKFRYNNENYAIAALMLEAASGRSYEDVCREVALKPARVSAQPSPRSGAFLPWGGWQMTVADYALWHSYWFGKRYTPKDLPRIKVDGGVHYGLGAFTRELDRGQTAWHFGALCFPGRMTVGSFVVTLFGDWTIMAAYDACVDWNAMAALDQTLVGALFEADK